MDNTTPIDSRSEGQQGLDWCPTAGMEVKAPPKPRLSWLLQLLSCDLPGLSYQNRRRTDPHLGPKCHEPVSPHIPWGLRPVPTSLRLMFAV